MRDPQDWLLYSDFSVILAFVHLNTVFMIVPIVNSMSRIDRSLIEAAYDVGATGWQTLTNVVIPLCKTGIAIGSIFVITVVMGDFITIGLMGGQQIASIGKTINVPLGGVTGDHRNDLPRSPEGFALIGDHRNDENLLVAQTHLAMLKFHNKVCDQLIAAGKPADTVFAEARQIVTWHYQWMVLHDFVERITEKGIVAKILEQGRRFYRFKKTPYMPVEFSGAAYRLGHSMVREVYSHNRIFTPGPGGIPATLQLLFTFTGLSGGIVGDLAPSPPAGPTPISNLPSNWIIDWRRFYDVTANPAGVPLNSSRKLDPFVVPALHTLPGGGGSLPFRNLKRGVLLGLPSGQDVARAMRIKNPLTPAEIAKGPDGAVAKKHGLHEETPLWYYILKEAEQRGKGEKLGPVGATIVSEVFVGLVHGDHTSYLWLKGKNWKPTLPSKTPGEFTMADLLRFVGDISPIDGITTV